MTLFKLVIGFALAFAAGLTSAAPVSASADQHEASIGDTVTVKLEEASSTGLDAAATISISYLPTILRYVPGSLAPGSLFDTFFLELLSAGALGNPSTENALIIVSLLDSDAPTDDGTALTLLSLDFEIIGGAGTTAFVDFTCFDSFAGTLMGNCQPGDPASLDYAFDQARASITVLADATNPIPLPGTLPLLALGVASLWWSRRRMH